jgi:hypothetical protein
MPNIFFNNFDSDDEDSIDEKINKKVPMKKKVTFIDVVNIIKVESYKKYYKRK